MAVADVVFLGVRSQLVESSFAVLVETTFVGHYVFGKNPPMFADFAIGIARSAKADEVGRERIMAAWTVVNSAFSEIIETPGPVAQLRANPK